jgi:hypothetical protein
VVKPPKPEWRMPPEIAHWPGAGLLCDDCGQLHGGPCPAPVTEVPEELFDGEDDLTPLGAVVTQAAKVLVMRGWLDPDSGGIPDWILADLARLAREPACGPLCQAAGEYRHPSSIADHFLDRRQADWDRAMPVWECDCGRRYKLAVEPPGLAFYELAEDGRPGDPAGDVELDAAGRKVRNSGSCPACRRRYADTITDRLNPQQALF